MSEEKNTTSAENAKPKKSFNAKKLKYGSAATAITIIVIALVVLVNVIVTLVGKRTDLTIDLTSKGNFEISQETIDYITNLTAPVEIVTMSSEDTFRDAGSVYYKQAYEVLKKYALNSDKITVKFVDMTADPTYANKYAEIYKGNIAANNIVVSSGSRIKVLTVNDLFNTELNYQTFSYNIVSSKAEQALTSAIMYVTDPAPKSAAIMDTGETDISNDAIRSLLEDDGFDVFEFDPNAEDFPYDSDIMVINAPINDLSEDVITKLYNYLENDGNYGRNLIYLASYSQKATKNIDAFLAEWGIEVGNGVVGDQDTSNLASNATLYAIRNFIEANDYSGNVAQMDLPVISYFARPVNILFENSGNVSTYSLLKTADTSFVFTDEMQQAAQNGENPEIVNGSYSTIALGSKYMFDKDNNSVTSNLLVFGSSAMLDSTITGTSYYNNGDYFVSIVNAMTGKDGGISIVAKDLTAPTFDTTVAKANAAFWVFVVLIPAAILITGIVIWLKRRHK